MVSNSKSDIQSNVIIVCFGMNLVFTDVCNLVAVINSSYFNKRFALRLISNEILTPQFESCEVHASEGNAKDVPTCSRHLLHSVNIWLLWGELEPIWLPFSAPSSFCAKDRSDWLITTCGPPCCGSQAPVITSQLRQESWPPKISESLRSIVCALYRVIPHSIKVNETNRTGFLIA